MRRIATLRIDSGAAVIIRLSFVGGGEWGHSFNCRISELGVYSRIKRPLPFGRGPLRLNSCNGTQRQILLPIPRFSQLPTPEQQLVPPLQGAPAGSQEPPVHALVSYWQVPISQLRVPPVKPRLRQSSASGTPSSHSSLPSTTPSPHTACTGAQTRLDGFPPVQLPTPEQQFVLLVQGCPSPSATQETQSTSFPPLHEGPQQPSLVILQFGQMLSH